MGGHGGSRIKELRADTGTKVFIENDTIAGHQMVRVIGTPDAIHNCIGRLSDVLASEAGSEEHAQWARLINFSECTPEELASTGGRREDRKPRESSLRYSDRGY